MSDSISLSAHTGLVVQPYRTDRGEPAWVFRCWGTEDGCDGWLSLDHTSAQSAARALTNHVAEFHPLSSPTPEVKIRITGGLTDMQRAEVKRIIEEVVQRVSQDVRTHR